MIWFSCKQCGKTHGRPETAAGATIFCECGQGLVVPWESTAAEPPEPLPLSEPMPALRLEPIAFEAPPARHDPPPDPPGPPFARGGVGGSPAGRSSRRRPRLGPRDPNYCFNHETVAKQAVCDDCGESFCRDCLVGFEKAMLCGPCKNYRIKNMQRAVPPSNMAIASALVALLAGPLTICLLPKSHSGFPWPSLLALVPQAFVVALSILALREAEKDPKTPGRSLALTGLVTAGVTIVLILMLMFYAPQDWS